MKNGRASSMCVMVLVIFVLMTKTSESLYSACFGYPKERNIFHIIKKSWRTQAAERIEETVNDGANDSGPQSMKVYDYPHPACIRLGRFITINKIWDSFANSADDKALKDMCLSFTLFWRLVGQRYFGVFYPEANRLKAHNFVFNKLLPSEGEFKRAFTIVEAQLGFCYDLFFTKYPYVFFGPVPFFQPSVVLIKIILIFIVGVLVFRKTLVLETSHPMIEVHPSEADYIITLLVLSMALIVELVQATFYLASNWAQVSLTCMDVN